MEPGSTSASQLSQGCITAGQVYRPILGETRGTSLELSDPRKGPSGSEGEPCRSLCLNICHQDWVAVPHLLMLTDFQVFRHFVKAFKIRREHLRLLSGIYLPRKKNRLGKKMAGKNSFMKNRL